MKKSIVALGMVLALSGCAAAADETLAAEPAALVEISPATEETAQLVEAAATAEPAQTATPAPTPEPTQAPTPAPTAEPTEVPTAEPTQAPVEETVAATPAQVSRVMVRCRSTLQPVRSNGGASTAATAHTGPCRRTSTPSVRRRDFPRWQWTAG